MSATRPVDVRTILPWKVTDLSLRPFPGMWSFNPSVHFDGATWRCTLRCADYAMPNGTTIRGELSSPSYVRNRNVMVELDPDTWQASKIVEMIEADNYPRITGSTYVGFADLRLFLTEHHGLEAIGACMSLGKLQDERAPTSRRKTHRRDGASHPTEQAILTIDVHDGYRIVDVYPLRGGWSGRAQKNWSPFDRVDEPTFLYSIDRGIVFDSEGPTSEVEHHQQAWRGSARGPAGGTGGYHELRGGTQLVHIGDALRPLVGEVMGGAWLSLAHDMRYVNGKKFYWHVLYAIDSSGRMLAQSEPFKLVEGGIEFAAGLAIDGDRAIISFGVDDIECKLAETSLAAMLGLLQACPGA